jgi:hypothetical protein
MVRTVFCQRKAELGKHFVIVQTIELGILIPERLELGSQPGGSVSVLLCVAFTLDE